jgi:hypothetical protein
MPRPSFIQVPTLRQQCAVFNLIRKGRKIVSKAELIPEDAVDLRELMDVAEREFGLPHVNDNKDEYERDLDVLREVLKS